MVIGEVEDTRFYKLPPLMEGQPEQSDRTERTDRTDPSDLQELARRLREAGSEELVALVRERSAELDPALVGQALRNPFCTAEVLEEIAAERRLLSHYEVRRAL